MPDQAVTEHDRVFAKPFGARIIRLAKLRVVFAPTVWERHALASLFNENVYMMLSVELHSFNME